LASSRRTVGPENFLLRVVEGRTKGRKYFLTSDETVLGSGSDVDLLVEDPFASRSHCRIARSHDGYEIEDMGSRNGTMLDGRKVKHGLLRPGSVIAIGQHSFEFLCEPATAPGAPVAGGRAPVPVVDDVDWTASFKQEATRLRTAAGPPEEEQRRDQGLTPGPVPLSSVSRRRAWPLVLAISVAVAVAAAVAAFIAFGHAGRADSDAAADAAGEQLDEGGAPGKPDKPGHKRDYSRRVRELYESLAGPDAAATPPADAKAHPEPTAK
jgi:pSer/pThr/pTyr-binding forkhead associated (FHA) protein